MKVIHKRTCLLCVLCVLFLPSGLWHNMHLRLLVNVWGTNSIFKLFFLGSSEWYFFAFHKYGVWLLLESSMEYRLFRLSNGLCSYSPNGLYAAIVNQQRLTVCSQLPAAEPVVFTCTDVIEVFGIICFQTSYTIFFYQSFSIPFKVCGMECWFRADPHCILDQRKAASVVCRATWLEMQNQYRHSGIGGSLLCSRFPPHHHNLESTCECV